MLTKEQMDSLKPGDKLIVIMSPELSNYADGPYIYPEIGSVVTFERIANCGVDIVIKEMQRSVTWGIGYSPTRFELYKKTYKNMKGELRGGNL